MLFQGQELVEGSWFNDEDGLDWTLRHRHAGLLRLHRDLIALRRNTVNVSRGLVMKQHPSKGTAPQGSEISIVVSRGPKTFPIPNVAGMSKGAAASELQNLGLHVQVVVIPSSSGNTVVGQNPHPGTTVRPGDSVTIYVA